MFSGRQTIGLSTARRWRSSRSIGRPSSSGRSSCLHSCDSGASATAVDRPSVALCMRGLCEMSSRAVAPASLHSFFATSRARSSSYLARPRFRARARAPALPRQHPPWPRTLRPGRRAPNRAPTPAHPTRHCPGKQPSQNSQQKAQRCNHHFVSRKAMSFLIEGSETKGPRRKWVTWTAASAPASSSASTASPCPSIVAHSSAVLKRQTAVKIGRNRSRKLKRWARTAPGRPWRRGQACAAAGP